MLAFQRALLHARELVQVLELKHVSGNSASVKQEVYIDKSLKQYGKQLCVYDLGTKRFFTNQSDKDN